MVLSTCWLFTLLALGQLSPSENPFFYGSQMPPETRYAGMLIDIEGGRSVTDITSEQWEQIYGAKKDTRLVSNVMHDDEFWIARIPENGSHRVYFLREWFKIPLGIQLAHMMFMVTQNEDQPIELIARIPSQTEWEAGTFPPQLSEPIQLQEVVVTVEARWAQHEDSKKRSYNPFTGLSYTPFGIKFLQSAFVNSLQIRSLGDKGRQSVLSGGRSIQVLPVNTNPNESSRTLMAAIDLATEMGMSCRYNLFWANCANTALEMLERARPPTSLLRILLNLLLPFSEVLPPIFRWGLLRRGYLDPKDWEVLSLEFWPRFHRWFDDEGQPLERPSIQSLSREDCAARLSTIAPQLKLPRGHQGLRLPDR